MSETPGFNPEFQPGDTVYIVSYVATEIKARTVTSLTIYRNTLHYVLRHPYRDVDELFHPSKVFTFDKAKAELVQYCQDLLLKAQNIKGPANA